MFAFTRYGVIPMEKLVKVAKRLRGYADGDELFSFMGILLHIVICSQSEVI